MQAGALTASAALSENVEAEGFLLNRFYIHIMFEARLRSGDPFLIPTVLETTNADALQFLACCHIWQWTR